MIIWDYIIPAVTAAIAGVFSFIAGKRKSNAEIDSLVVGNAKEIIEEWKNLRAQREKDNEELTRKVDALEARIEEMQLQIDQEKARYKLLHHEYLEAIERIEALKKRVTTQEKRI